MKLFGIKNCDTVRKARKWLEANNNQFEFVDFREDGISKDDIQLWCDALGWETVFNKRSTSFRALDDADKTELTEQKAIALMLAHPTLIKRPVLQTANAVHVGFNDKNYSEWLK